MTTRIAVSIMDDNGRTERGARSDEAGDAWVALGFRRSVLALVVLAFAALVGTSFLFGGGDERENIVAPAPIPDATSSTVSTSVT